MIVERITDWDSTYPLYRASWRGLKAYGTTQLQAFSNMLGVIDGLKWENYAKSL